MAVESKRSLGQELQKKITELKYYWFGKYMVEVKYAACIKAARQEANTLEAKGNSPETVSKKIQEVVKEKCPDLELIVDPVTDDVYVEIVSAQTRIYFNWRYRAH